MTVYIEHLGQVHVYIALGIEVITAIVLGGLVGLDRERKMKAAGIKTNILICLGSTLYTAISLINYHVFSSDGANIDPNRLPAQIVSGIGFLGAGAILQSRGTVLGLTTAATIWVVAALGVAIGSGRPVIAVIATVTVLFVLRMLDPFYRLLDLRRDFRLEIESHASVKSRVVELLEGEACVIHNCNERVIDKDSDTRILSLLITMNPKRLRSVSYSIKEIILVKNVNFELLHRSIEKILATEEE